MGEVKYAHGKGPDMLRRELEDLGAGWNREEERNMEALFVLERKRKMYVAWHSQMHWMASQLSISQLP